MERIKLSKGEKRVLRTLSGLGYDALGEFDTAAIRSLDRHGLVQGAYIEGHGVEDARLTTMGKAYLMDNPKLRNPIDWKWIAPIAAVAAIILFIIGCALIKNHGG